MAELSCAMVQSFAKGIINRTVSDTIMDIILAHVLQCKECKKHFKMIAKDMGLKFDVKRDAAAFINNKPEARTPKTRAIFIEMYGEDELEKLQPTWSYYADTFDLQKLMNLKCVNDFTQEKFEVENDPKDIECFAEFGRYITKKLCADVDKLEDCYKLEVK